MLVAADKITFSLSLSYNNHPAFLMPLMIPPQAGTWPWKLIGTKPASHSSSRTAEARADHGILNSLINTSRVKWES